MTDSTPQPLIDRRDFFKKAAVTTATLAAASLVRPALAQEGQNGPVRAMRAPHSHNLVGLSGTPSLPPLNIIALNRLAFGPRPGDLDDFQALGASDEARLQAYIDQQLDPASIDDGLFEAQLTAAGFETLNKTLTTLWAEHRTGTKPLAFTRSDWDWRLLPAYDTERVAFNRAIHSRRQLQEVLVDFWHNHFNVYGYDGDIAPVMVHYDRDVIRPHILGNFRQMLEAVAKSTAMLYYLDNRTNSGGKPNENYARELFELHTMGAENYLGELPQAQVPVEDSRPIAYVDDDVYGATTCFTGWQVDTNDGAYTYNSNDHFPNQKVVFGQIIPANQADEKDGRDVFDMLGQHPGTGRYIARKLCRRFISDNPPERIVNEAAALFTAQWQAPDQLKQVVRTILLSPEFRTTWGEKIKRPFEVAVGALRAMDSDFFLNPLPFDNTVDDPANDFLWSYNKMGQRLFSWRAPTGYPDLKEDWSGTVPMIQRWRLCHWLVDWQETGVYQVADLIGDTPPGVRSPNGLVDFWSQRLLGRSLEAQNRQIVVEFIAQGRNPDFDLPLDTDDATQHRLRSMVGLILNSPDYQWR